jgi:hypothetical protein
MGKVQKVKIDHAKSLLTRGDTVDTGVVVFDDDWPGVFLRGKEAVMFASMLQSLQDPYAEPVVKMAAQRYVASMTKLLYACNVTNIRPDGTYDR